MTGTSTAATTTANVQSFIHSPIPCNFDPDDRKVGRVYQSVKKCDLYKKTCPKGHSKKKKVSESVPGRMKDLYDLVERVMMLRNVAMQSIGERADPIFEEMCHIIDVVLGSVVSADDTERADVEECVNAVYSMVENLPDFIDNCLAESEIHESIQQLATVVIDGKSCLESIKEEIKKRKTLHQVMKHLPESNPNPHALLKALATGLTRVVIEDERSEGKVLPIVGKRLVEGMQAVLSNGDTTEVVKYMKQLYL
jgi:hypothetical protein